MPARFEKMGIAFQYPENWTLDEEDALSGCQSVTIYSPESAFWSVSLHPRWTEPERLARAALDAMKQEYEGLEAEQAREMVGGHELVGFDMNFYCLDLTNSARVRCLRNSHATYAVFYQAEDREFARLADVFRAVTASLVGSMT